MSEHGEKGEEEEEEEVMSPKPPPFARAPSFEVVIDPMDEPWEWPAKQEKNTEDNSDDSDDDFFGRGSAASNEEVVCLCNLMFFRLHFKGDIVYWCCMKIRYCFLKKK